MNCEDCREELSARMDGEDGIIDVATVDDHLTECAECAAWQRQAARITRSIRVRPASATPDLTAAILAAADQQAADQHSTHRQSTDQQRTDQRRTAVGRISATGTTTSGGETWRWLLGLIALAQLSLGLAQLLGVSDMGHMVAADSEHLFNESTAWNIALGMGFAGAAAWPRLAAGLLPTLGVFVAVLSVVSVIDLVNGEVELSRVASHLVVVVGMAVLLVVHHHFVRQPGPARARPDNLLSPSGEAMPDRRGNSAASGHPGGLRPAGRHAA